MACVRKMRTTMATTATASIPITTEGMAMRNLSKWVMLSLLLAPGLPAQTKESLLIGPGDLLHVQVFETPELEEHARVTDAGELPLIMGGGVKVAALTPVQAAHAIEDLLLHGH